MSKNQDHCILEFKLYTLLWQADRLAHMFDCAERMYNIIIRYANKQLAALRNDDGYKSLISEYVELLKKSELSKDEQKHKRTISKKLNKIVRSYGLSEFQFHSFVAKLKNESFYKVFDINTAQKIATYAWTAVQKVLYGDGKKLHFKKHGSMQSFEGKDNKICLLYTSPSPRD